MLPYSADTLYSIISDTDNGEFMISTYLLFQLLTFIYRLRKQGQGSYRIESTYKEGIC